MSVPEDTAKLIERLRRYEQRVGSLTETTGAVLAGEAADAVERLTAERDRLAAALHWYAEPDHWNDDEWGQPIVIEGETRGYDRARAALAEAGMTE